MSNTYYDLDGKERDVVTNVLIVASKPVTVTRQDKALVAHRVMVGNVLCRLFRKRVEAK